MTEPNSNIVALEATLRDMLTDAQNAPGFIARGDDGQGGFRSVTKTPAVVARCVNMREASMPGLMNADGQIVRAPAAEAAAKTVRMDAAVVEASRVAAAGANVIVYREPTRALATGKTGVIAVERRPGSFRLVTPATFAEVADDDDISSSQLPVTVGEIDMTDAPAYGVRFEFSRSDRRKVGQDVIFAEILNAIARGLARTADSVLLSHLTAASLADFSLSAAAAKDLKFNSLRAIVGTSATGAAVGADGILRANGVRGELTADIAGSIIGAFDRSAVVISDNLDIHFERTSKNGDIACTAWANLKPCVPDAGFFWKAVAP